MPFLIVETIALRPDDDGQPGRSGWKVDVTVLAGDTDHPHRTNVSLHLDGGGMTVLTSISPTAAEAFAELLIRAAKAARPTMPTNEGSA